MQFRIHTILMTTLLLACCLGLARWFRFLPEPAYIIVAVLLFGLFICGVGIMIVAFMFGVGILLSEQDAHRTDNFRQCVVLMLLGILALCPMLFFVTGLAFAN